MVTKLALEIEWVGKDSKDVAKIDSWFRIKTPSFGNGDSSFFLNLEVVLGRGLPFRRGDCFF